MSSTENNLRKFFEKELIRKNIPFQKGVRINNLFIDYLITREEKKCVVQVKANHSSSHNTIGEIVGIRNSFSHVFLLASNHFMKKFQLMTKNIDWFQQIGLMAIENGELKIIQEAKSNSYYTKKVTEQRKQNYTLVNDVDVKIFEKFKDTTFMVNNLAKGLNITSTNAYQKIKRLKRMGLLEVVNDWHPKIFRIKEAKKLGDRVEFTAY